MPLRQARRAHNGAVLPFIVLISALFALRAAGAMGVEFLGSWVSSLRAALGVMFCLTASAHWGKRRPDLIRMVPPSFPRPDLIVTVTGVLEILGAIGLQIPAFARAAGTCLAILLAAMFPANIHAARHNLTVAETVSTRLPIRAALQAVFIGALLAAGWAG